MRDKQTKINIQEHNEKVAILWNEYQKGSPGRVPVQLVNFDERFFIMNKKINAKGITWKDACTNADAAIQMRIQKQYWWHTLECFFSDSEIPVEDFPDVWEGCAPYFESAHECAMFGAEVNFPKSGDNPDNRYCLDGDKKWDFTNFKIDLDPEGDGVYGQCIKIWKEINKKCKTLKIEGRSIKPPILPARMYAGDGPFSIACSLRGSEVMIDMYEDPDYYHSLMNWITDAIIAKGKATNEFMQAQKHGFDYFKREFFFSDDSAAMVSEETYKEFILPYDVKVLKTLYTPEGTGLIHMCGNAQHLFKVMLEELNPYVFETGFPCDLGRARQELGANIALRGNLTPALLHSGPVSDINKEVLGILRSGVTKGRKFVMTDGTNIPPCTPMDNLVACYEFAKEMGVYVDDKDNTVAMNALGESTLPWNNFHNRSS